MLKLCPLKKLNVVGNDFSKKVKRAYTNEFKGKVNAQKPVLSKYSDDDEDEEDITRLLANLKI